MKKRNIFLLQGVVLYFIFSCFLSAQERPQLKLNPTQSETITVDVNLDLITGENGIALVKFQKVYDVRNGATIDTNIKLTGIPTRYNYYLHRNYTKNNCPPDEIKVSGQCYPEDYGILLCPAHQFCHKAWVIPTEDEWYKAAYHKNDGDTGNYFDYPTSSDTVPGYVNNGATSAGPALRSSRVAPTRATTRPTMLTERPMESAPHTTTPRWASGKTPPAR